MKFLLLILPILLASAAIGAEPAWQMLGSRDGISVYSKEIPGSPIIAFRGECLMPASLGKVLSVLSNAGREKEWVDRLAETHVVREISDRERVEYSRTSAPWPMADRDFVVWERAKPDPANKRLVIDMRSISDAAAPLQKGVVRGEMQESTWILTAVGPQITAVSVEIAADPRGAIPKWIVNLFQRSWPRKTLESMRRQVQKSDVGEYVLGNQ